MNAVIRAAVDHARTVLAALVLILIAGSIAYRDIPKESAPDINIPIIYVSLTYEGIAPEDAERLLLRPVEQELRGIAGLKEMRSTAFQGGGNVILEFDAGFNADLAMADVRRRVDAAKSELPDEADEPKVEEVNFSLFPVIVVGLAGAVEERALLRLARDLQDRLESLPNVLEANIAGDREELVEILVDPLLVESYGLNAQELIETVSRSNRVIAAGNVDTGRGRFAITVPGLFRSPDDILNMPVKVNDDAVVRIRDIAEVRRTFKDPEGFARVDGRPALAIEVVKRTGRNVIETIEQVQALVEAEREAWPAGIEVSFFQDQSIGIRTMLSDLQNNVISAVLLVMIVVVAALGLRSGLLVGVAIPGSFLAGILVIGALGLTINIVVLFSLILAVGMLVDGAIVVTEYADRKMTEGEHRRDAYILAAQRMAWPITAATATTLAAFLPLVFWPGVVGEFMKFLPITLLATLTASLAMALIFVPTLGAQIGRPGAADPRTMKALAAGESGDISELEGFTGAYVRVLRGALRRPGLVLLAAVGLLVGVQWYYATHGNGIEFFPDVEPERAALNIHARGNLSVFEQDALVREVERRILDMAEFSTVYARTGKSPGMTEQSEDVIGTVQLEFVDWRERRRSDVVLADVLERTRDLVGIWVEPREEEAGPPVGKPVQIRLSATRPDLLSDAVGRVREGMDALGGFTNVEDSRPLPGIDWEVTVDRAQAGRFGADVTLVGNTIKMVTNGIRFGGFRPDDAREEIDIVARYPAEFRTVDQLDQIRVQTDRGLVPISNFVTRAATPKVGSIDRVDGRRVMTVKADVAPGLLPDTKTREIRAWLERDGGLDPRVTWTFTGEDEEQKAAQDFLGKAFGVALFLMAIILVTQFNSFYSAFLIMSAVILSTIGVFLGLIVTGQPFGIVMNGIGVIALAGIVVNNNIVLIDTFDRLKRTEPTVLQAVLRTGAQRLRPVLLTTITTILGLVPMVLGVNIDFVTRDVSIGAPSTQWWNQLATTIVSGLAFATVLTLIVTPSALMLRENLRNWRLRQTSRQRRHRSDAATVPEAG
jgi:multidrug efflux pump